MKKIILAVFLTAALAGISHAENTRYMRAMFGVADAMQGAFTDGGNRVTSSASFAPSLSAALGLKFENNFALEAEFYTVSGVKQRWTPDQRTDLTAYMINAAEYFPFRPGGKLNPFVGAGAGVINSTFALSKSNAPAFNIFLGALVKDAAVFRLKYLTGKTYGSPHNIFGLEAGYKFKL